jgi:hypothetical protein
MQSTLGNKPQMDHSGPTWIYVNRRLNYMVTRESHVLLLNSNRTILLVMHYKYSQQYYHTSVIIQRSVRFTTESTEKKVEKGMTIIHIGYDDGCE